MFIFFAKNCCQFLRPKVAVDSQSDRLNHSKSTTFKAGRKCFGWTETKWSVPFDLYPESALSSLYQSHWSYPRSCSCLIKFILRQRNYCLTGTINKQSDQCKVTTWILRRLQFGIVCFCFSIVSEDGASVYSASPEAATELPSLEASLRGAGKEKIYLLPVSWFSR